MRNRYDRLLVGLFLLLGLCSCKNAPEEDALIICGEPVENISEIPWQVGLIDPEYAMDTIFCGGSIIKDRWVLTAAHCLEGFEMHNSGLQVLSGTVQVDDGGRLTPVESIYVHPAYNEDNLDNDIALLKLATPLELGADQNRIMLPFPEEFERLVETGSRVTVSGWGFTNPVEVSPSRELRKVEVVMQPYEECRRYYAAAVNNFSEVTVNMICAADLEKDACKNDSGGPLFLRVPGQGPLLIGVVSWGIGCAEPTRYGVYTKTSNYIDWISSTIEASDQAELAL